MTLPKYEVVNVVASMQIGERLDLELISKKIKHCEYDPEFYHALKFKNQNPKITILVQKNGKIIFCGGKSLTSIENVKKTFFHSLEKIGYLPMNNPLKIENIVVISQFENHIDINKFASSNFDIQYEPESFPGLFFKNKSPKFTASIFKTGKFSIIGLKDLDDIIPAIRILTKNTRNYLL